MKALATLSDKYMIEHLHHDIEVQPSTACKLTLARPTQTLS